MTTYFPLDSAFLCVDCNSVVEDSRECPACASGSMLSLAQVLNRNEGPTPSRESVLRLIDMMEDALM